jgi:RNA polymerase sigma-70 factor (ECF subfamily)
MDRTPASLLERLQVAPDEQAWVRLVDLYTPLLYGWTRRLGLPAQDAGDLVQDVLTVLVQKLPEFTYDRHKRFRGWLWTILLNKWRDIRRRERAAPVVADNPSLSDLADPNEPQALDEAEYRHYLVGRALDLMRSEFQPTTWQACWEYVVVGRPAAEVAAQLGTSVAAIYVAKSRVLSRLRRELDGLLD